jgi:hypothetical protein
LVIAGFVRGLSVRDVEATLAHALCAQAALSKSTVSRVCQAIRGEFDTWGQSRMVAGAGWLADCAALGCGRWRGGARDASVLLCRVGCRSAGAGWRRVAG